MEKVNGVVLYRGPSMIDGAPIVCILTGLRSGSSNSKTGAMLQTWILRADMNPVAAVKAAADSSICGDCPHRGIAGGKNRTCYVNVGQGPAAVFKAFNRGSYASELTDEILGSIKGRAVRFGSYGDPAAVPVAVWRTLAGAAGFWTGYTHQWAAECGRALRPYCMASVDTEAERARAVALGWRTFRVALPSHAPKLAGEARCPASKEAGAKIQCADCRACNGAQGQRGTIVIQAHGGFAVMAAVRRADSAKMAA